MRLGGGTHSKPGSDLGTIDAKQHVRIKYVYRTCTSETIFFYLEMQEPYISPSYFNKNIEIEVSLPTLAM